MKLSTSTRISLGFTLLTVCILSLFSTAIYQLFNRGRQQAELKMLRTMPNMPRQAEERGVIEENQGDLRQRFLQTIILDIDDTQAMFLLEKAGNQGLKQHQDKRYMYRKIQDKVILRDVTSHVERQEDLFRLLLLGIVGAAVVSFLIGQIFVKRALRDVYFLTESVRRIDIERLDFGHKLDHLPPHDELVVLANTLSSMTEKLALQVHDIKQFVAHAAHELRTPLMILRASTDVAMKTKEYKTSVEKIQKTVLYMQGLIDTLLLLARSEIQNLEKKEIIALSSIQAVLEQLEEKYPEKDIHIDIQSTMRGSFVAHQTSFERIMHNLIDNAYKYTPVGGIIHILLTDTYISITDTGIGMTGEQQGHIWKPFRQADESRGTDAGFGLGLALVKRLVDMHGWHIEVVSQEGKGTTFTLRFL